MILIEFVAGVIAGWLAHQTDAPLRKIEQAPPHANRAVWYLLVRYIIGVVVVLVVQRIIIGEKRITGDEALAYGFVAASSVGTGVGVGHLIDDWREG